MIGNVKDQYGWSAKAATKRLNAKAACSVFAVKHAATGLKTHYTTNALIAAFSSTQTHVTSAGASLAGSNGKKPIGQRIESDAKSLEYHTTHQLKARQYLNVMVINASCATRYVFPSSRL
jgi:hypothetical protein